MKCHHSLAHLLVLQSSLAFHKVGLGCGVKPSDFFPLVLINESLSKLVDRIFLLQIYLNLAFIATVSEISFQGGLCAGEVLFLRVTLQT